MTDEDLNKYLAREQNSLDHITKKLYGPGAQFDKLSPLGQHTIESLVRERALVSDPDPELRHAKVEVITLRREVQDLTMKLAEVLKDNQELFNENEDLKNELYDAEEDRTRREHGNRQG